MRRLMLVTVILALATTAGAAKLPAPSKLSLVQAQCGRCSCAADPDCGAGGTCGASQCTAGDVGRTSCLTAGDCAVGQSCSLTPHTCSASFVIGGGIVTLKSFREPAPTCPKTGNDPHENKGGDVRLTGITRDGTPFTGTLTADVLMKTSFGADPNGTCALAGTAVPFLALEGSVACRNGKCKGTLYAPFCLPKECADTSITSELVRLVVRDPDGAPLGLPGIFLAPAATDAP